MMDASELSGIELFAELTPTDRERLAEVMRTEDHPVGSVLVEEGDLPSKFFVLISGHVTVHRQGRHLADLGPGDYFGEVGILSLESRNASVIATTPVRVAASMGWDLRRLLEDLTEMRDTLTQTAAARARLD